MGQAALEDLVLQLLDRDELERLLTIYKEELCDPADVAGDTFRHYAHKAVSRIKQVQGDWAGFFEILARERPNRVDEIEECRMQCEDGLGPGVERARSDDDPPVARLLSLLTEGVDPTPEEPTPSQMLSARYAIVPYIEVIHEDAHAALKQWRAGTGVRTRLFHGTGGVGKTRLFVELCRRLRQDGWTAGFLQEIPSEQEIVALLEQSAPLFLVVDYAEGRRLEPLLAALAKDACRPAESPVRLVLLARGDGEWWRALRAGAHSFASMLERDLPFRMEGGLVTLDRREAVYTTALQEYASIRQVEPPSLIPCLDDERFGTALYLHAAALESVEQERLGEGLESRDPRQLLSRVLEHEQRIWIRRWSPVTTLASSAQRTVRRAVSRVVAAIVLRGGVASSGTLHRVLRAAGPTTVEGGHHFEETEMLLRDIYPPRILVSSQQSDQLPEYVAPLKPDLLAELLVKEALEVDLERVVDASLAVAEHDEIENIIVVLGRLAAFDERLAEAAVDRVLSAEVASKTISAVRAILALDGTGTPNSFLGLVAEKLIRTGSKDVAKAVEVALPAASTLLAPLAVWSFTERLEGASGEHLAHLQARLGHWKIQVGDYQGACRAAGEAVKLWRELEAEEPGKHRLALAGTLTDFGTCLGEVNRPEEALVATKEAVDLYVNGSHGAQYEAALAGALNNLANRLSDVGDHESAMACSSRAVETYSRLNAEHPDLYSSHLAAGLSNLANRLKEAGDLDAAAASATRAIEIREEQAADAPDTFLPKLAGSRYVLAEILCLAKDFPAALAEAEKAEVHRRSLAGVSPAAHGRDLAASLAQVATVLRELGRSEEAAERAREAVNLLRGLAARDPGVYKKDLALVLGTLARALVESDASAALEVVSESEQLGRELMQTDNEQFRPMVAETLQHRAICLRVLRDPQSALRASTEAIKLLIESATTAPKYAAKLGRVLEMHRRLRSEVEPTQPDGRLERKALRLVRRAKRSRGAAPLFGTATATGNETNTSDK